MSLRLERTTARRREFGRAAGVAAGLLGVALGIGAAGAAAAQQLWSVEKVAARPGAPDRFSAPRALPSVTASPVADALARVASVQVEYDYLRLGTGYLQLPLANGAVIEAENAVFEDRGNGNLLWTGEVPGAGYESVLFTLQDGHLVGWFGEPGGTKYVVRAGPDGQGTVTVEQGPTGDWCGVENSDPLELELGSQRPDDNETWGPSRVSPPGDVAPGGTAEFTFTITAPAEVGRHRFRWRMVRGADGWFGRKTENLTIIVEDPSFGDAAIADQTWVKGAAIAVLTLHEAGGAAGPFTYALTPDLPAGVTFSPSTRAVAGTPTAAQAATKHAYTATDANGSVATLSFTVTVSEATSAAAQAALAPPPAPTVVFDFQREAQGGSAGNSETPGWTAESNDAVIARPPAGLDAGASPTALAMLLRGSGGGGDGAPDAAITERWIPVDAGTYRLSACMWREHAGDNVFVDFDGGAGRDGDFLDAHIVARSTGVWECGAVTKCIPDSVGAIRVRAVREGANMGDAWFDMIELKRIAACGRRGANPRR